MFRALPKPCGKSAWEESEHLKIYFLTLIETLCQTLYSAMIICCFDLCLLLCVNSTTSALNCGMGNVLKLISVKKSMDDAAIYSVDYWMGARERRA